MEIGLLCIPWTHQSAVEMARDVDSVGAPVLLGLADSPGLFAESYAMQQLVLAQTEHIKLGPFVTNPVSRHWSVHAAAHRTLENIYGAGRTFFALAAGDSAVHAVGLRPANNAEMGKHAEAMGEHGPDGLRIMLAAGGIKAAATAGRSAGEIVLGQGVDAVASEHLTKAALDARQETGIDQPFKRWLYVFCNLQNEETAQDQQELDIFRSVVMAQGRQAVSSYYSGKNVSEAMQERLPKLFSQFSFANYRDGSNARLLEEYAAEEEFLTERFVISGRPEEVAKRIKEAVASTGVDGVWVNPVTTKSSQHARSLVEALLS